MTLEFAEALFASPLFSFGVPNAEALNAALVAELVALRERDPGIPRSLLGPGWHSREDFFACSEPACTELQRLVVAAVRDATRRVAPGFRFGHSALRCEGWVNVLGQGGGHTPHVHPAHHWSGVYYIAVPTAAEGSSGAIEFLDPRTSVGPPALDRAACFADTRTIQPRAGQLLVFPSYLRHWVYPNTAGAERVAMAFNARWEARR